MCWPVRQLQFGLISLLLRSDILRLQLQIPEEGQQAVVEGLNDDVQRWA